MNEIQEGISKSLKNKIQIAIRKIKKVMEVDSMREMYKQYLFQDKQIIYLEQVKAELIATLSKLRNEAPIPATHRVRSNYNLVLMIFKLCDNNVHAHWC